MGLPKIIYDAGSGDVTVQFVRGPQNFRCYWKSRVHDNVATSGLRERVTEGHDMMIAFEMRHIRISDDFDDWSAFMLWALDGGEFEFYPDGEETDYYHLVSDDEGWEPTRNAPAQYAAAFRFRVVPDEQAPADVNEVMERFYGVEA
jgi:hypothetical protein